MAVVVVVVVVVIPVTKTGKIEGGEGKDRQLQLIISSSSCLRALSKCLLLPACLLCASRPVSRP